MKNDPLHELLNRADGAIPPPAPPGNISRKVLLRARGIQRRQNAMMSAAAIFVVGAAFAAIVQPLGTKPAGHPVKSSVADLRAELARLDIEARSHLQTVNRLRLEKPSVGPEIDLIAPPAPDALDRVTDARNRAALILLRQAEGASRGGASSDAEPRCLYADAARLFPETSAGQIAARRLKLAE